MNKESLRKVPVKVFQKTSEIFNKDIEFWLGWTSLFASAVCRPLLSREIFVAGALGGFVMIIHASKLRK